MINMKNTEQASAVYALAISAIFAFLSFYNTDAETYLFPRIIAIVLAILSVILFISNSATGENTKRYASEYFTDIWPGLVIGFIYLLTMEDLGFYISSFLAFLAVLILYGRRGISNPKALGTKVAVSAAFMLILFLLFWNGLHVRTPTGLIF
ncbi:MAG: tripartite tricarboxylate transporter TctB family protein [Gammaproteobacteria bacterium]|nr:tripartite tricarboxylate transporter TctB family protein [Gammaproteobacteria bacterium]